MQTLFYREGFKYNQNITLTEKKRSISDKYKVTNIFNKYFFNITKILNIPECKPQKRRTFQNLDITLDKYSSHPSVIQIKGKANKHAFSFSHVLPWETYRAILSINQNKKNFPSELKMADVIPIFKKDDSFKKENYRPISLLSS